MMDGEMVRLKVDELPLVPYGDNTYGDRKCEFGFEDICEAIKEGRFDERPYAYDGELYDYFNAGADYEEFFRRLTKYHIERIAYLVHSGKWSDPVTVNESGAVTDGNHRVWAAKYLNQNYIYAKKG